MRPMHRVNRHGTAIHAFSFACPKWMPVFVRLGLHITATPIAVSTTADDNCCYSGASNVDRVHFVVIAFIAM